MKNSFWRKLAVGLAAVMAVGSFAACGNTQENETGTESTTVAESTDTGEASAPEEDKTLVYGIDTLSGKFSVFLGKTAYDQTVAELTSVSLLEMDREGNPVLKGIEGETISYGGTDYTYRGIADCEITQEEDGTVFYDFTLRDDIVFSDGTPLTIDDVIFSLYVYSDPTYEGASTLYSMPIRGMTDYRGGMESVQSLIVAAGKDNTDFTHFTKEQQDAYWAAVETAGAQFAQDIVDYCVASYSDELESAGGSEVALGMLYWGFGEVSEDGKTITAASGATYDTATVTTADYWSEIYAKYEGDLQTASDTETANTDLFTYIAGVLGDSVADYEKGVLTGESADYIAGIEKTGASSLRITADYYDASMIYHLAVAVSPLHYYGSVDLYDYDSHQFGFPKGDLSGVRAKTGQPLGAGPYVFQSYENGMVTYTANAAFYKGGPKIPTLLLKETQEADKLSGVVSGAFDLVEPSMSVATLEAIKEYNGNGEIIGDVLSTVLVDNLGYGYIGINAQNVKVGDDPASEASKSLRKAFATLYSVYRETVVYSYYAEMANVINYPISNTSWAAPKPGDEGYAVAYSTDADGNPLYTEGMTQEEKNQKALEAAVGFLKAAGYSYDEAAGIFTAAPAGASLTYEVIIPGGGSGDHPAYGILTSVKEALAGIGLTLEINDPVDTNVLWTKVEGGTNQMWAAAWGATPDPDLYQVYYSTNIVGGGGTESNHYGLQDPRMDELIMEGRTSADRSFRKAVYMEALSLILDWAVEVPTYQRQNATLVSSQRVNLDTLTKDMTPYWGAFAEIEILEMN
ncbi:MAG: ABC transporter substrate-binding protein [Clostridium sp.]|jgi:peptide/nickel transport system substrate-binding protein|nr:ABC transporter substrate-binding protein [Clostridium sp.]